MKKKSLRFISKHVDIDMETATKETIQKWIANSVKPMLANDDGAVYYYRIKGGISFVLAWIPCDTDSENKFSDNKYTIEASVRKTDSSYFIDDWTYIGEGVTLQTADESNHFAAPVDWIFNIALTYLKPEIFYMLPNNVQIELLSEMHTANFDFGDFDEPIGDLRKTYYEVTGEVEKHTVEQKIEAQCTAFADFLGIQYGEIQSMISITDLSLGIKHHILN